MKGAARAEKRRRVKVFDLFCLRASEGLIETPCGRRAANRGIVTALDELELDAEQMDEFYNALRRAPDRGRGREAHVSGPP